MNALTEPTNRAIPGIDHRATAAQSGLGRAPTVLLKDIVQVLMDIAKRWHKTMRAKKFDSKGAKDLVGWTHCNNDMNKTVANEHMVNVR